MSVTASVTTALVWRPDGSGVRAQVGRGVSVGVYLDHGRLVPEARLELGGLRRGQSVEDEATGKREAVRLARARIAETMEQLKRADAMLAATETS